MPTTKKLRILFVINPISGGRTKSNMESEIHAAMQANHFEYQLFFTTGKYDEESIKYWLETWTPDKVVAIGGDGTLKMLAQILIGQDIPIGIVPAGSANGMATDLGIPADIKECLEIVIHGEPKKIDIIKINDKDICLHLSDVGINAQMVKYFEENNWRGKLGYARGMIKALWRKRKLNVEIVLDDETVEREARMVVLANARMYGTGIMINPDGDYFDGRFEVVIIRKISIIELFKMLFKSRRFNKEKTEIVSAHSVVLRTNKKAYFQVDGEYRGKTKEIRAIVEREALMLIFPPGEGMLNA